MTHPVLIAPDTMPGRFHSSSEVYMTATLTLAEPSPPSGGLSAKQRRTRLRIRLAIGLALILVWGGYIVWSEMDFKGTDLVIEQLRRHGSLHVQRHPWYYRLRDYYYQSGPFINAPSGRLVPKPKPLWLEFLDFMDRSPPRFLVPTRLVCNQFIIDDEDRSALRLLGNLDARLNGIRTLYVRTAEATDDEFRSLKELKRLQALFLRGSSISDSSLQYISGLRQLKTLDLSDTSITDAGLKHLRGLVNLEFLELNSTQVTDAGLEFLTDLSQLKRLSLEGTQVTNVGMQKLRAKNPKISIIVP
ncbi:MAG: hypothetical protein U0903_21605 [Planctomycetales bacterium]